MAAIFMSGVSVTGVTFGNRLQPISLDIVLGLFVGKSIGTAGATWFGIRSDWCTIFGGT